MAIVKRGKRYGVVVYDRGQRNWIGTYATKEEAKDAQAAAQLSKGSARRLTVGQFASTWLERYPRPKRSTEIHYAQGIRGFVTEHGTRQLRALTRPLMREWAVSHRPQVACVRAMLGDAQRDGLIAENPLTGLRLPQSRGRRDETPPSEIEVNELALAAEKVWGEYGRLVYGPMILVAAYTGLRPGELHALRWTDITPDSIRVERQYSHRSAEFTTPKNGNPRTIELLPPAAAALARVPRDSEQVWLTPQGAMFTGRVSHYYWHPVRIAVKHPEWDFYSLRHAFGTLLARKDLPAPVIAEAMGHTDGGKLALERYIHYGEDEARGAIRQAFAGPARLTVVSSQEAETA